jgi:hypothetical protein
LVDSVVFITSMKRNPLITDSMCTHGRVPSYEIAFYMRIHLRFLENIEVTKFWLLRFKPVEPGSSPPCEPIHVSMHLLKTDFKFFPVRAEHSI